MMAHHVSHTGLFLFIAIASLTASTTLSRHGAAQVTPDDPTQFACDLAHSIAAANPGDAIQRSTGVFAHDALPHSVRGCRLVTTGSFENAPADREVASRSRIGEA